MNKIKDFIKSNSEIISYIFWGGMTTFVNWAVYYPLSNFLHIHYMTADVTAWIISVLFAYITNRRLVFHSDKKGVAAILKELLSFISGRIISVLAELTLMYVGSDILGLNSNILKIIVSVIVVVLNYIFSKIWAFKK